MLHVTSVLGDKKLHKIRIKNWRKGKFKKKIVKMGASVGYDNYLEDQYHVPFLAKVLHSLPHLNISLHRTNNTFRPTDEIYLEVHTNNS